MGLLNSLLIAGGGAAQGYRSQQETIRQVAEAKRKALLDEREQAVREQLAQSQEALGSAQAANLGATSGQTLAETAELKRKALESGLPVSKSPLTYNIGGRDITIPNELGSLDNPNIASTLQDVMKYQFMGAHPQYYLNYPPVGSIKYTEPLARKMEYIKNATAAVTARQRNPIELADPETAAKNDQAIIDLLLNTAKTQDPEALSNKSIIAWSYYLILLRHKTQKHLVEQQDVLLSILRRIGLK